MVVEVPPSLKGLLGRCPGIDHLLAEGERLPPYDCQAPLMSLPALLGTTLETVPASVPYLWAEAERCTVWGDRLGTRQADEFRIGLVWQGNPRHKWDHFRSAPLAAFAPLAERVKARWVSLQLGEAVGQIAVSGHRFWIEEIGLNSPTVTFLDTAAVMTQLDLVIAVDTAIAHLAGALGVPVWIALAAVPDWRWLTRREDTPWYPTARLFRQQVLGDWSGVVSQMGTELTRQINAGRRGPGRDAGTSWRSPLSGSKKILTCDLARLGQSWRATGRTVVWTNGCFDLLHVGHAHSLQAARRLGDVLVVGVNADDSVHRLKGPGRPILSADERAALVAALGCVDHVVVFDEDTPEWCLAQLRPDIHCKGADYAPPHGKPVPEAVVVESYGGRVEYLPLVAGLSTTDLVHRIKALPAED